MKYLNFLFLSSILVFASCSDSDESASMTMNFKLKYADEPLVFFEEYEYPDGRSIEFTRFSFYLSDISSLKDGEKTSWVRDEYIDLTASHSNLSDAEEGFDYVLDNETGGGYDALQFNLGLTPAQNQTRPEDYPSSSSLSLTGEYWSNWESYVFVKIEARSDLDGDGISDGIALHLGADDAMRSLIVNELNPDLPINISIDLEKVFNRDGEVFDIVNNSRIHSLDQIPLIQWLMDGLVESLELTQ
ncbi:MAG: MbnP family protein [Saprospiraceae bacterium]|jgi:hypothetical protein